MQPWLAEHRFVPRISLPGAEVRRAGDLFIVTPDAKSPHRVPMAFVARRGRKHPDTAPDTGIAHRCVPRPTGTYPELADSLNKTNGTRVGPPCLRARARIRLHRLHQSNAVEPVEAGEELGVLKNVPTPGDSSC